MIISPEIHKKIKLLNKIEYSSINEILTCLKAKVLSFKKDQIIYHINDSISNIGIILSGTVQISSIDFWGNRSILTELTMGDTFGEVYAIAQVNHIPVEVIATSNVSALFIPTQNILNNDSSCAHKQIFIIHLLQEFTNKNLMLTKKIEHLSKRSIREKLNSYLSSEAIKHQSATFEIPFNRQELADYLSIDRSACSYELSKMKKEKLLNCHKNKFTILKSN